jgi:hypothetical protein
LLLAVVFAVRIPFLSNELVGEEGEFAFLVASPTPSSQLSADGLPKLLAANLDGKYALDSFQHAVIPYVFLERIPGTIVRQMRILSKSPISRIIIVRMAYLSLFLGGVLGLAWLSTFPLQNGTVRELFPTLLIPLYALTTPLAVGGSIQPQIDGAFGVLTVGVVAALLLPSPGCVASLWRYLVAGCIVGLGRAEWALAFFVVSGVVVVFQAAKGAPGIAITPYLSLLCGVVIGVAVSVAASPDDYVSSFLVAQRVSNHTGAGVLALRQAQYVFPICAFTCAVAAALMHPSNSFARETPGLLVAAGSGVIIFLGFAISGFSGDGFPRYYAPALTLLAYGATWLSVKNGRPQGVVAILTLGGLVWNASYLIQAHRAGVSITSIPGLRLAVFSERYASAAERAKRDDILTMQPSGIWLTYPDTRFMAADYGYPGAVDYLTKFYPDWIKRFAPDN